MGHAPRERSGGACGHRTPEKAERHRYSQPSLDISPALAKMRIPAIVTGDSGIVTAPCKGEDAAWPMPVKEQCRQRARGRS